MAALQLFTSGTSILFLAVGLCATVASGSYYPPIVPYGIPAAASAGYLVPAYVPPYAAYHVAAPAAAAAVDYQRDREPAAQQPKHYQHDAKYYYGGKFQGSCSNDGLYYKDEAAFVICSNGYPSDMSCPPGTKTAEYPSYQAGYYYGYTDLCSVNLVDYGYGPASYSASHQPAAAVGGGAYGDSPLEGYKEKSYHGGYSGDKDDYSSPSSPGAAAPVPSSKETYSTPKQNSYPSSSSSDDSYPPPKSSYNTPAAAAGSYSGYPSLRSKTPDYYAKDEYINVKEAAASYPLTGNTKYNSQSNRPSAAAVSNGYPRSPKDNSNKASYSGSSSNPYVPRDSYAKDTHHTVYGSSNPASGGYQTKDASSSSLYPPKGSSHEPKPAVDSYASSSSYGKVTYPAKTKYSTSDIKF
jgi:hypothetical protein